VSATSGSTAWLHAKCPGADETTVGDEVADTPTRVLDAGVEPRDPGDLGAKVALRVVVQPASTTATTAAVITHLIPAELPHLFAQRHRPS
jgi:hypothetical protein